MGGKLKLRVMQFSSVQFMAAQFRKCIILLQFSEVQFISVQYSLVLCSSVQFNVVQCILFQLSLVYHSAVQSSSMYCMSAVLCSSVYLCALQYNMWQRCQLVRRETQRAVTKLQYSRLSSVTQYFTVQDGTAVTKLQFSRNSSVMQYFAVLCDVVQFCAVLSSSAHTLQHRVLHYCEEYSAILCS